MMTRNAVIVHGCSRNWRSTFRSLRTPINRHWIPWIKRELEKCSISAVTPHMPRSWNPTYEGHKNKFERLEVNDKSVLIGHSCACAFLVRWLGETKTKIDTLVLVAPWKIVDKKKPKRIAFYEYDIDRTIADRVRKIVIFTSDNERKDGKKSAEIFHAALGGELVSLPNHGHYMYREMNTEEFPELLDVVLK